MTLFILLALGLLLLAIGGELLLRGAVAISHIARITPAVIGLTIVAMGTSLPELAVTAYARLSDLPDVAMGNVIGSNIFNLAVILGIASLIVPLQVHRSAVRLEWPFMFVSSFAVLLIARDGMVDRIEGAEGIGRWEVSPPSPARALTEHSKLPCCGLPGGVARCF